MPPTSSPPSKPGQVLTPGATGTSRQALRQIVGGYDIDRWPIHLPRAEQESLPGWLRRLARRYRVTPGAVLEHIGIQHRAQVHPDLTKLLRDHLAGFTRAGLHPDTHPTRAWPLGSALERLDSHFWTDVRNRRTPRWRRASRYCPACLATTGTWQETWHHPYHLACLQHGTLLESRCPTCGASPYDTPTWLTYDGPVDTCHHFTDDHSGRYRRRCTTPLGQRTLRPAEPDLIAAQTWLWDLLTAVSRGQNVTIIGLDVDPATAYAAAGEIITENTIEGAHIAMPDGTWEPVFPEAHGLLIAHRILTQPAVADAATLAAKARGFHPQQGAAPIGPQFTVTRRPRNPVIAAISLQQHQGRLTVGAELAFRVGSPAPGYPHSWQVKTTPLTASSAQTELPLAWIPTTLWTGSFTLNDHDTDAKYGIDTPTGRTFAALALARYGSTRPWRLLAVNLALPARSALTGARHWHKIDKAGLWPAYMRAIVRLFDHLHAAPPPIDYERRRITAQPTRITAEARRALTAHPHLGIGRRHYARALWAAYTQAEPDFAPADLHATTTEGHPPIPEEILSESARRLGKPDTEPLAWHPP